MLVGLGMWNQGKIGVVALPRKKKKINENNVKQAEKIQIPPYSSSLGGMTTRRANLGRSAAFCGVPSY